MRAATEGYLPPVIPKGKLVEVLGREVRRGAPGELMVESSPSRQRRPPCKTGKEMPDEAADAAVLTYLTYLLLNCSLFGITSDGRSTYVHHGAHKLRCGILYLFGGCPKFQRNAMQALRKQGTCIKNF